MELFGIKFVGLNPENGRKLLLTLAFIVAILVLRWLLRVVLRWLLGGRQNERARFWARQGISLLSAALIVLGVMSIWFDDPTRLTTAMGLVTAGLAFALQKVVTAFAGYFVILRGRNFSVGDRIAMGGVRGDVIALGFIQTTIMEMGEPPPVQSGEPAVWVKSRQFTGRIVSVTNDKIFDEPIYNYTRDFPYIWEELTIPITYQSDRARAEQILLQSAVRHGLRADELDVEALHRMHQQYFIELRDFEPRVFLRITDNWLELTVRLLVREHGIRLIKDAMSREVLAALDEAGIGIASATYDIVGFPPLRIEQGSVDARASHSGAAR